MNIKFEMNGKKFKVIPQFENVIDSCSGCYFNTNKNNDCGKTPRYCTDNNVIYVEDKDERN